MIDKRFYEHREKDPIKAVVGVAFVSLTVLVLACWFGSMMTGAQLNCPKWLNGAAKVGPVCVTGPFNGFIWNAQYRWFPSRHVRANIRTWQPRYRRHFFSSLNTSLYSATAGVLVMLISTVLLAIPVVRKQKNERVMIEGTRFWANDEEVFATGLAVNYRAPLLARVSKWFGA